MLFSITLHFPSAHSFLSIELALTNQAVKENIFFFSLQKDLFNAFILIHYFYLIQLFCHWPQWHRSGKLKAVCRKTHTHFSNADNSDISSLE